MYLIDKEKNMISKISEKTFTELGFKERENLQEWLDKNPEALGEELLIIQKEFCGFKDTLERLDLLALDKDGNLVIIENKLDDTGKDVTWQALKYASYCSTLKTEEIKSIYQEYLNKKKSNEKAEDKLLEFFEVADYEELSLNKGQTQRVMLVAANFRKEVTSTVLWLLNYNLRLQCFKVTPYQLEEKLFLDLEQIIPMKDAEEYIISMAEKTQHDITSQEGEKLRYTIRKEFWAKLLKQMNSQSTLFQNINPTKDFWISTGIGFGGITFAFVISKRYARSEIYIGKAEAEENKAIFDELKKHKEDIEKAFGTELEWERLDTKKSCRIKAEKKDVNIYNKDDWPNMMDFMIESMINLEKVFKEPLKKIKESLK